MDLLIWSVAGGLVFIGLLGALFRRHLLIIALSIDIALFGIFLLIAQIAFIKSDPNGGIIACTLLLLAAAQILVICGAGILGYRQHGSLHMDEFRELRG